MRRLVVPTKHYGMRPTILWFRRDLRLRDNPALNAAIRLGAPVVPVYIRDETPGLRRPGAASHWWLDKSLRSLARDLESLGSRLILASGNAADRVVGLADQIDAETVMFNAVFDPGYEACDLKLAERLTAAGRELRRFNGNHLLNPTDAQTKSGAPFSVFTPFWRASRQVITSDAPRPVPASLQPPPQWPASENLADWNLHPSRPDWSAGFADWAPGEPGAAQRLENFVNHGLESYSRDRDRPGIEGTSRLSPHLHFGEISPKACWRAAIAAGQRQDAPDSEIDKFLSELGWREFSTALVTRRGDMAQSNYDPRFDQFPWRDDPPALLAWQRGQTGYPIVDAGMRQLWTTGWMHNRVRMICASFLTKHLMLDWRLGEAWFWDTLVDADHAANAANWQWVAGSGADAAPYFRIFNPILQGQKFDAEGTYVRRWIPEVSALPTRFLHVPWTAPSSVLAEVDVRLGETYPLPIVDHGFARQRALDAYAVMRRGP